MMKLYYKETPNYLQICYQNGQIKLGDDENSE